LMTIKKKVRIPSVLLGAKWERKDSTARKTLGERRGRNTAKIEKQKVAPRKSQSGGGTNVNSMGMKSLIEGASFLLGIVARAGRSRKADASPGYGE